MDERVDAGNAGLIFARRALVAAAIGVAVYGLARGGWTIVNTVFLLYLAVIVGIGLRGMADFIAARTPLGPRGALALILVILLGTPVVAVVVFGGSVAGEVDQLRQDLPELRDRLDAWLSKLLLQASEAAGTAPPPRGESPTEQVMEQVTSTRSGGTGPSGQIFAWVSSFVGGVTGAVGGLLFALIVGAYLAASPSTYMDGLLLLVPASRQERAHQVLDELGEQHRQWLFGQLVPMALVTVAVGSGLMFLGVPYAAPLALLAGLLDFVPNFGPVLAVVPAILVAAGTGEVVHVLVLYTAVQLVEGWILRPYVEKRAVDTPPVLLLAAQVVMATLVGGVGLIVAPALLIVLIVLVKRLYVEDALGKAPD